MRTLGDIIAVYVTDIKVTNDIKKWEEADIVFEKRIRELVQDIIGDDYKHGDVLDGIPLPMVHRDLLKHEHAKQRQRAKELLGDNI